MSIQPENMYVAVVCGGRSKERDISLASGMAVKEGLDACGFRTSIIDPAVKHDLQKLIAEPFDLAFLALHGKGGEDGSIQGFLETAGIPYTGSGIWSSSTAIDKSRSKELYRAFEIPTPASVRLHSPDQCSAQELADSVGAHCVVKAATEGSTLGVYICETIQEIEEALTRVFEIDDSGLAEAYVSGKEYTCAVLGSGKDAKALPLIQIIPTNDFYDYESKYAVGGSQHLCPAPLSEELTREAQRLSVLAHQALECEGASRTDLILDENGEFWVLETNTIPGMTQTSLLPDAARAEGMDFSQLCLRLVEEALR